MKYSKPAKADEIEQENFMQKMKSQEDKRGQDVAASSAAKNRASQTEDEQRITKWSKHSWATMRGKNC